MPDAIEITVVDWSDHSETLSALRRTVFIEEQHVPVDIEQDGLDATSTHFLLTRNTEAIGCARLRPDGKVGRMAVLASHRGQGYGRLMLDKIVDHARETGMHRLYLHAQQHAVDFYVGAGFTRYGDEFHEAGIPHTAMELLSDYSRHEGGLARVDYPEPFATLALALARSARRELRIFSPRLDHEVFDNTAMADAMSALARGSRYSSVRILVTDTQPMVKQGHRLLALSRRLSSSIHIQTLTEHPELPDDSFVIRDHTGIIFKPLGKDKPGFYEPNSRAIAKRHIELFDSLWNKSKPDPELRLLGL
jgi:predicted GNAT family N-acyltransferase